MNRDSRPCSDRYVKRALFAAAQIALGIGLGMFLAGRLRRGARRTATLSALGLGVAATIPLLVGLVGRGLNSPRTDRGMRRRLRSIRNDSGFPDDADLF